MQAKPVTKTIGGVSFEERFPHLHDDTPEALAFQWERDALAERVARASPNYIPVRDRLRQLADLPQGQAATHTKPPCKRGSLWFDILKEDGDELVRVSEGLEGPYRTITSARMIASDISDPDALIEIFWIEASATGRFIAVGWLANGEQGGKVAAYDVASGRRITEIEAILYTEARAGWMPDESGFWMGDRLGDLHRLRFVPVADGATERPHVVLSEELAGPVYAALTLRISPDGRRGIAVAEPHEHIALALLDLETLEPTPFLPDGWDGDCDGSWIDEEIFVARINSATCRGRIVAIPVSTSRDPASWRELVAEGEGFMAWAGVVAGRLYVGELVDVSSRVRVFDLEGKLIQTLPLETPGSLPSLNYDRAIRPQTDVFTFTYENFLKSENMIVHDAETGDLREFRPPAHALKACVSERHFAISHDGARVPYFTVHREDLDTSKPQPVLVFAYGGFNTSFVPVFPTVFVPFIEAGGIFVQASLRGGGEYGKAWHDAGRLFNKNNTFRDLEAVIQTMIDDGATTPDLTAFHGLSNGGVTAGAAVVLQPHLWRVVTPTVAIYDLMDPLPRTPENAWIRAILYQDWGDTSDPEVARSVMEWSPYQNIRDGVKYPAVFQVFGAEDTGCRAFNARKFTARLDEANAGDNPVYMRVWKDTGHAPKVGEEAEYTAEWLAFVMDQVGLTAKGPQA